MSTIHRISGTELFNLHIRSSRSQHSRWPSSSVTIAGPGLGGGVAPQSPIKGGSTPLQVLDAFFPLFFFRAIAEQIQGHIGCDIFMLFGMDSKYPGRIKAWCKQM